MLTGSRGPIAPPVFPQRAASGERSEDPTAPPAVVPIGGWCAPAPKNTNQLLPRLPLGHPSWRDWGLPPWARFPPLVLTIPKLTPTRYYFCIPKQSGTLTAVPRCCPATARACVRRRAAHTMVASFFFYLIKLIHFVNHKNTQSSESEWSLKFKLIPNVSNAVIWLIHFSNPSNNS